MIEDLFSSCKRRDRSLIIAKILDKAKQGASKTQIMYGVSLSFTQVNEYLSFLLDLELLEVAKNPKKTIYKTTEKGSQYLQSYREIKKLLKKERRNDINEARTLNLVKRGSRVILL